MLNLIDNDYWGTLWESAAQNIVRDAFRGRQPFH